MGNGIGKGGFYWLPKVLPLVYTDALSYAENIYALIEWCVQLCDRLNEIHQELLAKLEQVEKNANQYTDEQIEELKVELDEWSKEQEQKIADEILELQEKIEEFEKDFDEQISAFRQEISIAINDFKSDFANLEKDLNAEFDTLVQNVNTIVNEMDDRTRELWVAFNQYRVQVNNYIDYRMDELEKYIDEHTSLRNGNYILVNNPVSNTVDTLRNTLEDIYNSYLIGAISADKYADMELAAEQYAEKNISAHEYAVLALFVFFKEIYFTEIYQALSDMLEDISSFKNEMRNALIIVSPITGEKLPYTSVISQLADFHLNTMTAEQYAAAGWSAEEYGNMGVTAKYYALSSAGYYGNVIGGNIYTVQFMDTSTDIVNNIMNGEYRFVRGQPTIVTVIASDGLATGNAFFYGDEGCLLLTNSNDVIRMYYNAGNWTTVRI